MKKHSNSAKKSEPTWKREKSRGRVQRDTKEVLEKHLTLFLRLAIVWVSATIHINFAVLSNINIRCFKVKRLRLEQRTVSLEKNPNPQYGIWLIDCLVLCQ